MCPVTALLITPSALRHPFPPYVWRAILFRLMSGVPGSLAGIFCLMGAAVVCSGGCVVDTVMTSCMDFTYAMYLRAYTQCQPPYISTEIDVCPGVFPQHYADHHVDYYVNLNKSDGYRYLTNHVLA